MVAPVPGLETGLKFGVSKTLSTSKRSWKVFVPPRLKSLIAPMSNRRNQGASRNVLRGAQSPALTWMHDAELAGAMYLPSGAPRPVEYPFSVMLLVLNARRVFR